MSRGSPLLDVRCREVNVVRLMTDVFTGVWTRCLLSTSTRERSSLSFECFSCLQCILETLRSLRSAMGIRSHNCLSCSDSRRSFYSQGHLSPPCLLADTHVWLPLVSSFDFELIGNTRWSRSSCLLWCYPIEVPFIRWTSLQLDFIYVSEE